MGRERIELAYNRESVKKQTATAGCFRIIRHNGSVRDYASTAPTSDRMSGDMRSDNNQKAWLNKKDFPNQRSPNMGSERIELPTPLDWKSVKKNCAPAQFFRILQ